MPNRLLIFAKNVNRLFDWRLLLFWIISAISVQVWIHWQIDSLIRYQEPTELPETAATYDPASSLGLGLELVRIMLASFSTLVYGVVRGLMYNPFSESYKNWLLNSPWTSEKKLPLGPWRLKIHDLVVLAAMTIPFWDDVFIVLIAIWFVLAGYALSQVSLFYRSNQMMLCWVCVGLFATSLLLPIPDIVWSIPLAITLIFGTVCYAQKIALQNFRQDINAFKQTIESKPGDSSSPFGFAIGPIRQIEWKPDLCILGMVLAVGWAVFCVASFAENLEKDSSMGLYLFIAIAGIVFALAKLRPFVGCQSPLNRWTIQGFIQPKFDVIFVAPLALLAIGTGLPSLGILVGYPFAFAVTMVLLILGFLYFPPDVERWKTTGPCRFVLHAPINMKEQKFNDRRKNYT